MMRPTSSPKGKRHHQVIVSRRRGFEGTMSRTTTRACARQAGREGVVVRRLAETSGRVKGEDELNADE
jgi:membrane protein implicated in regulation of membrane protease activity